jgi:hypothetical protein
MGDWCIRLKGLMMFTPQCIYLTVVIVTLTSVMEQDMAKSIAKKAVAFTAMNTGSKAYGHAGCMHAMGKATH